MKTFDLSKQPVLPLRNGQSLTPVTVEKLTNSGLPFIGAFGLSEKGEVVEFYDIDTYKAHLDETVRIVKVRKDSDAEACYVACLRDNRPSWVSMGSLQRMARKSVEDSPSYACDFSQKLSAMDNNLVKLEYLASKIIKVTDLVKMKTNKFTTDGVRLDNEYRDINVPVISVTNA